MKTRKLWADFDPESKSYPFAFYTTRDDQRNNRPDLKPIPGIFIPRDAENMERLRNEIDWAVEMRAGFSYPGLADDILSRLGITAKRPRATVAKYHSNGAVISNLWKVSQATRKRKAKS